MSTFYNIETLINTIIRNRTLELNQEATPLYTSTSTVYTASEGQCYYRICAIGGDVTILQAYDIAGTQILELGGLVIPNGGHLDVELSIIYFDDFNAGSLAQVWIRNIADL